MFDLWGSENSTLREKVVEHLFLGELSKEMLLRRQMPFEVLRSEFDGHGYDVVVEAQGVTRHIQFKHSRADSKVREQKINLALAEKPAGCVIWTLVDRETMSLGPFFWLDGSPDQLRAKLGAKVATHTKGNKDGEKNERAAIRVVSRSKFDRVGSIGGLATMLLNSINPPMCDAEFDEKDYWTGLIPIERRCAETTYSAIGISLYRTPPVMLIENSVGSLMSHFLFSDGSWIRRVEDASKVHFPTKRNGFYDLGGRYIGKRPPPGMEASRRTPAPMVNSGYQLDLFFQEVQVVNDFTFYLRQTALTHDIEHMVTGFGPNHGGEVALINANLHAKARYFRPELNAFFSRIATYLKAKTIMKDGLHYPHAMVLNLEAEFLGSEQGRNWAYPLMLVDWRQYVDVQIADIREELNITPVLSEGFWDETNRLCNEDDPHFGEHLMEAAE